MGYGSGSRMVERWPGIPADGLLTMPITLTVPLTTYQFEPIELT